MPGRRRGGLLSVLSAKVYLETGTSSSQDKHGGAVQLLQRGIDSVYASALSSCARSGGSSVNRQTWHVFPSQGIATCFTFSTDWWRTT